MVLGSPALGSLLQLVLGSFLPSPEEAVSRIQAPLSTGFFSWISVRLTTTLEPSAMLADCEVSAALALY